MEDRPYRNWRRERVEYIGHFHDLHRRNDLLQKRLDEAQAKIAKMQAERMPNGHDMAGHPVLGTIYRDKKRWCVRITISGKRFVKAGFLSDAQAQEWLAETSDAIGFGASYQRAKEEKALMVVKMQEIMGSKQLKQKAI